MDKIHLTECRFYGYHGAFQEEQKLGQIFVLDCELGLDLSKVSESDCLEDTIHYGMVFERIKEQVENRQYALIERLAGAIMSDLFDAFPRIEQITLRIQKENPPIAGHYKSVGIELTRLRP